eukprot:CAMPEP_0181196782 /NCGR_PEP_ID=MMETSP1096-20121128/15652_1 /TAXON_ID=156174 ORGANISM="Chrysochromulina ericina, Strain CCMP281" /NCGR_SAMPLE_ID=MMETSP1096 /ASSEMBLY_ACC=CAM_ASM_000453 /LENGTH=108 /DNA_ID=CAMNT_0023286571 /DNA_START=1220 /DNA_END=1547 /DNA_ORIENTATION=-
MPLCPAFDRSAIAIAHIQLRSIAEDYLLTRFGIHAHAVEPSNLVAQVRAPGKPAQTCSSQPAAGQHRRRQSSSTGTKGSAAMPRWEAVRGSGLGRRASTGGSTSTMAC